MSVGIMFIYFNKIKLKLCEKKAGLEPETDLFQATIMGTEVVSPVSLVSLVYAVYALWKPCVYIVDALCMH